MIPGLLLQQNIKEKEMTKKPSRERNTKCRKYHKQKKKKENYQTRKERYWQSLSRIRQQ
jgi:hypothetical protein